MGSRLLEPWVHTGPCFRHETLHFELGNREAIVFYGTTSELNWMLRQHPSRWTHKSTMQHTRELRNESQQGCRNCQGPSGRKWCKIPPSPTPPLSSHFVCKLELRLALTAGFLNILQTTIQLSQYMHDESNHTQHTKILLVLSFGMQTPWPWHKCRRRGPPSKRFTSMAQSMNIIQTVLGGWSQVKGSITAKPLTWTLFATHVVLYQTWNRKGRRTVVVENSWKTMKDLHSFRRNVLFRTWSPAV